MFCDNYKSQFIYSSTETLQKFDFPEEKNTELILKTSVIPKYWLPKYGTDQNHTLVTTISAKSHAVHYSTWKFCVIQARPRPR